MKSIYRNHLQKLLLGCLSLLGVGAIATPADALNIQRLSGVPDFGAEIPAYDPASQKLFVTNGTANQLDILDIRNPASPVLLSPLPLASFGGPVNSVAVKNGIVAVALEAATAKTDPGKVVFFNTNGDFQREFTVGALPDMLTFTPDGTKVLVANEGEPNSYNQLDSVDPEGSISIIDVASGTVSTAGFTSFNGQLTALQTAGVRITGPNATVAQDLEPEYITLSNDGATAWVTLQENNALAVVDVATATVTAILPLGLTNVALPGNAIDASDRDGPGNTPRINIQNWPVFGMYQPDAIASYSVGGQTYLVTANEGDGRDYPGFTDEIRVNNSNYVLDPTVFPNAPALKQNANLGRLTVSRVTGNTGPGGSFQQIQAFGARSFSIFDASGNLIFDSGDRFERITASLFPTLFNSDGTTDSFDTRSDNKGPEPEGVAIGQIGSRFYAFIGLERIGGFFVYDITDPRNPVFSNYVNQTLQFGDRGPEGVLFVGANESPNGIPLFIMANEVSRSVEIYSVESVPEPSAVIGLLSLALAGYGLRKRGNF